MSLRFKLTRRLFIALSSLILIGAAAGTESTSLVTKRWGQDELEQRVIDLNNVAVGYEGQHDYKSACAVLEQAKALWDSSAAANPQMHAALLANLADVYEHEGRWTDAIRTLQDAVAVNEQAFGAADARTARMQVRLGEAEVVQGDVTSADARLHGAVDTMRHASGSSKSDLALALSSVAVLDVNLAGRLAEAKQMAAEAVAIAQSVDTESADYGSIVGVLAGVYVSEGDDVRAFPLLTRSIEILERAAPGSLRLAPLLVQRGLVERGDHKYALAERDMQRAVALLDGGALATVNADLARLHLASLYLAQGKLAAAETILPAAVERLRSLLHGSSRRLALSIRELALLRAMQKRYAAAEVLYREAIDMVGPGPQRMRSGAVGTQTAGEKEVRALEQTARELLDIAGAGG